MRAELDQVDRLLDSFLVLARAQHGEFTDSGRLALDRLALDALAGRAGDIVAKGLTMRETRIDGSAWVWGSRTLLRRAADNVIDNAITHNDSGGCIEVAVRAEEGEGDGGSAVALVVESSGPVLDQRWVADLAQPFRRLGADRTSTGRGSGLGLSIVSAIVAAHHGTLDLHARPDGGLRVTVTLPRTDDRTAKAPNAGRCVAR